MKNKKNIIIAIVAVIAIVALVLGILFATHKIGTKSKESATTTKAPSSTTTTKESKTTTTTVAEEEETTEATTAAPVTTAVPATTTTTKKAEEKTTDPDYNNYVFKFYDDDMLNRVNAERAAANKPALKMDSTLCAVARTRVKELITMYNNNDARYSSHLRIDGSSFSTALDDAHVNWTACGENLAIRQISISEVMDSWMGSPGHKANILSEKHDYNAMGYAWCEYQGVNYWIQEFAYIP